MRLFLIYLLWVIVFGQASVAAVGDRIYVKISNQADWERSNEMVEFPLDDVLHLLDLAEVSPVFRVCNDHSQVVPSQITFDRKLIFPVTIQANSSVIYSISTGSSKLNTMYVYGRQYPERKDDIAWENERSAYRIYGPALQKSGEKSFGHDVWTKNTNRLVVEERYNRALDVDTVKKIADLKKADPKAAANLARSVSYHVDHGEGMDCYKVGPTLGCGTSALMLNDTIIYPYCYKTYRILDNGPLRFTVELIYSPQSIRGCPDVTETRVISLDAGSLLNKTVVCFANLKESLPIVTGLVLHEAEGVCQFTINEKERFMIYADPTDGKNKGIIYVGVVIPGEMKSMKAVYFSPAEKRMRGADGHLLAIGSYHPDTKYTYYWGAGWSKAGMTEELWEKEIFRFARKNNCPLIVTLID